jgi:hypothetical protein
MPVSTTNTRGTIAASTTITVTDPTLHAGRSSSALGAKLTALATVVPPVRLMLNAA